MRFLNRPAEKLVAATQVLREQALSRLAPAQRIGARLKTLQKFVWPGTGIVVLLGLALLGTQLRPVTPAAAMPNEPVPPSRVAGQQVIVWYALGSRAGHQLIDLVDEFNATNPWGITIVPQDQGTYTRLRQRLDQIMEHTAMPDLVALYPHHTARYAARDHVAALDPYLAHPQVGLTPADLEDFIPSLLEGERNPQFGNHMMSFPIGPSAVVLVYNLDWLRSIGYQGPPLTWGTFREACKQAMVDTNADDVPDTFGYAFVADAPTFSALLFSRGGQLLSPDGRGVRFNAPEGERALRILRDNFGAQCAYAVPGRDWDRGDLVSAKAMFNIVPSHILPDYRALIEHSSTFRWGVAPLPHNSPTPVTPLYGQSWTIFKTAPDRQLAAWLFVRWFAGSRQTQRWTLTNYTLPVRRSAIDALNAMPDLDPHLAQVLALAPYGQSEPTVAAWDAVAPVLVEAMRAVAGGMEPREALSRAAREAEAILQRGEP